MRRTVHKGRKIEVVLDETTLPDGSVIRRDMVLHPGAVVILPMVDDGQVCLIRNYRFMLEKTLWELPAGALEPGESPNESAVRELEEETGYRAKSWQKLTDFYPSPGVINEILHLYVARDMTSGPPRLEKDETIEPHVVPWDQAMAWATDGTIRDGKTLIGLMIWDRMRDDSAKRR